MIQDENGISVNERVRHINGDTGGPDEENPAPEVARRCEFDKEIFTG